MAIDVPDSYPSPSNAPFTVTSSIRESAAQSTVRSTFKLVPCVKKGASAPVVPRYGDKFYITSTDGLTGQEVIVGLIINDK